MARITSLLICDHAQVRENLLMVLSGGITRLHVAELPTAIQFTVAVMIEVPNFELDESHELRLVVIDPETAAPVAEPFIAGLPPDPANLERVFAGEPILMPMTIAVALVVEHPGQFDVRVSVDDEPAEIQSVWVVVTGPNGTVSDQP